MGMHYEPDIALSAGHPAESVHGMLWQMGKQQSVAVAAVFAQTCADGAPRTNRRSVLCADWAAEWARRAAWCAKYPALAEAAAFFSFQAASDAAAAHAAANFADPAAWAAQDRANKQLLLSLLAAS